MTDTGIGKTSERSLPITLTITCFIAIALYNVAELNFIIFGTFRNRRTLYFWSFLVSTWGIAVYSIGFLVKDLQLSSNSTFFVTLIIVGWCSMVTGQSVVLYSRLHLILRTPKVLQHVLTMIIVDAFICHIPTIILVYGANSNNAGPFLLPYSIYEKVQVTIFFIQELTISALYIVYTVKMLRFEGNVRGKTSRQVMTHLIYVNAIIVILDITILALEYSGLYDIQTVYKGLVYSLKLKLEFSILNRLVNLTQAVTGGGYIHSNSLVGERAGVHMETFNDNRRDQQSRPGEQRAGYNAYVHPGKVEDGTGGQVTNEHGSIVVLTTEITVHSHSAQSDGDSGRDSESIDGKSGVTGTSAVDGKDNGNRALSSSSSEVHFASTGF